MNLTVLKVSKDPAMGEIINEELEQFSGQAAAVCYMKNKYFDGIANETDKAIKRFNRVIETGHHSIADHCFITVLFEDIPKMTAMVLNSLGLYNTSEKSGRYTVMESEGMSKEIYDKWVAIFKKEIYKYDSTLDEKLQEKLAMENARYVLDVFAPSTTMVYTTSLRMWSYIVNICDRFLEREYKPRREIRSSYVFYSMLRKCIQNLKNAIVESGIYSDKIVDNKGRKFDFLANQVGYDIYNGTEEQWNVAYLIKYSCSFACLAQLQRHRTIDYFMDYDGAIRSFYVPKIIRDNEELSNMWKEDLEKLTQVNENYFPNATLVNVAETGTITNFLYKCDERLCGRVQLETFENVYGNLLKFARQWHKSPFYCSELEKHYRNGKVVMKCGNIQCKEPCHWGPIKAKDKLI